MANNGSALKAFNEKYSAEFMMKYCKDNKESEWWNAIIESKKLKKDGSERAITLAEVRSAFVRKFFPSEIKGAKKESASWRKKI